MTATPNPPIVQSKPRHGICVMFDAFLDTIITDQNTGKSNAAEAMRLEYGESLAAGIMQAAGIRKVRLQMNQRNGTPISTGASSDT